MSAVIDVALPVFAILAAGFAANRLRLVGTDAAVAFNGFVYWVALPPLLFLSLARKPLAEVLNGPFILAFLLTLGATALLGILVAKLADRRKPTPELVQDGLNACFPNTGNMGIPLFLAAFGPLGVAPAILATVIVSSIVIGAAVVGMEVARARGQGAVRAAAQVAASLIRNPLLVAPALGMAVSAAGIPLPAPLVTFGDLLGQTAGPCALFGIGLFLATQPLGTDFTGKTVATLGTTVLKLVAQPLIAWALVTWVVPLPGFWAGSLIILAALPTGALTYVVASRYGVAVERTSTSILVTTVLSIATLSAVLGLLLPLPLPGR